MTQGTKLLKAGRQAVAQLIGAQFGEPWRVGSISDAVVSDLSMRSGRPDAEDFRYYGGYLVTESVPPAQRDRIIAAVNYCAGVHLPAGDEPVGNLGMLRHVLDALEACYHAALRGTAAFASEDEMVGKLSAAEQLLREHGRRL